MFGTLSIGQKLIDKLHKRTYRRAYVAEHVRRWVAYQIRALRDQRGLNQGQFAKMLGKPQSVVSRLEDPSYGKFTLQTLLEVAAVFDVAIQIRFVPFSVFLRQSRDVSSAVMKVENFEEEMRAPQRIVYQSMSENIMQIDLASGAISKVASGSATIGQPFSPAADVPSLRNTDEGMLAQ